MDKAKYVIDASVFLKREKGGIYEEEAYPVHWRNFDKLIDEGMIISIEKVKKELDNGSDGFYKEWIKYNESVFKPSITSEITDFLFKISKKFPNWYQYNKSKADSGLIGFCYVNNLILVTQESINLDSEDDKNFHIPTIVYKIGGKCIPFNNNNVFYDNGDALECICFNELVKREKLYKL